VGYRIGFTLNSKPVEIDETPLKRLLDVLREDFNLTGPKEGCGEGECGACSVLVDGELVNSCLYPIGMLEGKEVLTIEGFAGTERFNVLKESYEEAGAVQCGFCTPGMIMASEALLREKPHPTEEEIRQGLSGNLCRCTGYGAIIKAVKDASERGNGLW
jgi:carbon-monoxide dehydrogenase small subunit